MKGDVKGDVKGAEGTASGNGGSTAVSLFAAAAAGIVASEAGIAAEAAMLEGGSTPTFDGTARWLSDGAPEVDDEASLLLVGAVPSENDPVDAMPLRGPGVAVAISRSRS